MEATETGDLDLAGSLPESPMSQPVTEMAAEATTEGMEATEASKTTT
jgi:hypothetical protein